MARATRSGHLLAPPVNGKSRLREIVKNLPGSLGLGEFTDKELDEIVVKLGRLIGTAIQSHAQLQIRLPSQEKAVTSSLASLESWAWLGPVDASDLRAKLRKASKACEFLLDLINVNEGLHPDIPVDSEACFRILDSLRGKRDKFRRAPITDQFAQDEGIKFHKKIDKIMRGVEELKNASDKAADVLSKTNFPSGRPKNMFYLGLTDLLIAICKVRGVKPTLSRMEKPAGRLFMLAKAMEKLLPKELQSTSDEGIFEKLKVARRTINKGGKT